MMNKTLAVKKYLEEHTGITSMQAIEMFGATRLSSIIYNLRNRYGMTIVSIDKEGFDRYNNQCRFVEYRLVKEA